MKISVSGKNIKVGEALREYVETSLDDSVKKYFDRAIDGDIVFFKEAHLFCTDIVVNEGTGANVTIKGQAKADDVYASFDQATARIEKQLRRYKRRLKNHHKRDKTISDATKYVISNDTEEVDASDENPIIIAEKQTVIETLTVSDAVMRMNLADLPALMFVNKKSGAVNVVYHRNDGNISWVDSEAVAV